VLGLTAIAGVAAYVAVQTNKAKKEQEAYNASLEKFNKVKANGISKNDVPQYEDEIKNLQKLTDERDRLTEAMKKFGEEQTRIENGSLTWTAAMGNRSQIYADLEDGLNKNNASLKANNVSYDEAKERINVYTNAIQEAKKATFDELNTEAKNIAQKKVQQLELQALVNQYKKAEVGSSDYKEAQKKLADQFPQFSTASGIMIDAIDGVVKAQEDSVQSEWDAVQAKIQTRKKDLETTILTEEAKRLIDKQEEELKAAAKEHIAEIVEAQKEELVGFARQQIDQIYVATSPTKGKRQPAVSIAVAHGSVDYTADMQPVRDQGNEGSVVGF
jgi:hypothetical protein